MCVGLRRKFQIYLYIHFLVLKTCNIKFQMDAYFQNMLDEWLIYINLEKNYSFK